MAITVERHNYYGAALDAAKTFLYTSSSNKDYFVYPDTDYSVRIVVGQIDFSDWSYTDCDIYSFGWVAPSQGTSSYISFTHPMQHQSGSISNPYNVLTYNSGTYQPQLIDRGGIKIETAMLFGVSLFLLFFVIRDIFSNVSRH